MVRVYGPPCFLKAVRYHAGGAITPKVSVNPPNEFIAVSDASAAKNASRCVQTVRLSKRKKGCIGLQLIVISVKLVRRYALLRQLSSLAGPCRLTKL